MLPADGGHRNGQNLKKIPNFIVKNGQQKPPQNRGGFCCIFGSFFLNFCLFLLVSCCFMTSWNPKTIHQMRLQAFFLLPRFATPRPATGVSRARPSGVSGALRAPECPKSAPRVSLDCQKGVPDTPGALSGHFLDTPQPRDTPRDSCSRPGALQTKVKSYKHPVLTLYDQEGTNVHFSNVHFVLCQIFGLNRLTPPFSALFPPSSLLLPH